MQLWYSLLAQAVVLATLLSISSYLAEKKVLRGQDGDAKSVPRWVQKCVRGLFLLAMFGPLCVAFWPLWVPFCLYLPSFTDLAELDGGRDASALITGWAVWRWLGSYLGCKLVKTCDIDPAGRYIFAAHPHGVLPFGFAVNVKTDASDFKSVFPGLRLRMLAASFCFCVPGYRDLLLGGNVVDAARYNAEALLNKGYSLCLVPGGATEALYASPDRDVLVLKKRKGFVRLAMKHGCSLVPVFSFNECNTYKQVSDDFPGVGWLKRKWQSVLGISFPLVTNIFPRRTSVTTVVGRPLHVQQVADPSAEQVEAVLERYIKEVSELYAAHGAKYNLPPTKELTIL